MTLTVSDDGIGFPPELDFMDTPSLGMQLVVALVEQLDPLLRSASAHPGGVAVVTGASRGVGQGIARPWALPA